MNNFDSGHASKNEQSIDQGQNWRTVLGMLEGLLESPFQTRAGEQYRLWLYLLALAKTRVCHVAVFDLGIW